MGEGISSLFAPLFCVFGEILSTKVPALGSEVEHADRKAEKATLKWQIFGHISPYPIYHPIPPR